MDQHVLRYANDPEMLRRAQAEDEGPIIVWHVPGVVDIDLIKSENGEKSHHIKGWCSTECLDRQEEVVVAKGLDFTEFLLHGYYNDNHKQETAAALGEPDVAKIINNRWWTEGRLYKGYPPADRVWELAVAMKKSSARRRLGFSIEGKVLARDGQNRILRAKVRNVAITNCPVNTECTWEAVAKSFAPANVLEAAYDKMGALSHDLNRNRDGGMDFAAAVDFIQKSRPDYSRTICARIARYAMCRP